MSGIRNHSGKAYNAIYDMGQDILWYFNQSLGINSPSLAFKEAARYMLLGVVEGLQDDNVVINSVRGLANKMLDSLSDTIDTSIVLTPKIAPVLDLSAVTRGANELPSIFARPRLAVAPSSLDDSYSEGPTGVSKPGSQEQAGVQFTQNNYSPKALSQVEIYRQTQNQISTFKRKVAA